MINANTALWNIPNFDFGIFFSISLEIPKNLFTFSNSPDPDQRAPTGALLSGYELFEKLIWLLYCGLYRVERKLAFSILLY